MIKANRNLSFIADASTCDMNLYLDGPKTLAEARKIGPSLCPYLEKCKQAGSLHPETGHQCVMQFGRQVAKFSLKEGHSVSEEMKDFLQQRPRPPKGWIYSSDRKTFSIIPDGELANRLIEYFAHIVLMDVEEGEEPKGEIVGSSFADVMNHAIDPASGAVDLRKIDALEGRFGSNGGRGCDVLKGPCSCGAWH